MGPLIAIVGRPNVGKSTLFNTLVGQNLSLVADFPGLTRDRKYGSAKINDFSYIFIDTAGITDSDDEFEKLVLNETQKALKEADGFLFLVDATNPLNSLDLEINNILRKSGKEYLLCVNKSDQKDSKENLQDFYELGVKITLKVPSTTTKSDQKYYMKKFLLHLLFHNIPSYFSKMAYGCFYFNS